MQVIIVKDERRIIKTLIKNTCMSWNNDNVMSCIMTSYDMIHIEPIFGDLF